MSACSDSIQASANCVIPLVPSDRFGIRCPRCRMFKHRSIECISTDHHSECVIEIEQTGLRGHRTERLAVGETVPSVYNAVIDYRAVAAQSSHKVYGFLDCGRPDLVWKFLRYSAIELRLASAILLELSIDGMGPAAPSTSGISALLLASCRCSTRTRHTKVQVSPGMRSTLYQPERRGQRVPLDARGIQVCSRGRIRRMLGRRVALGIYLTVRLVASADAWRRHGVDVPNVSAHRRAS